MRCEGSEAKLKVSTNGNLEWSNMATAASCRMRDSESSDRIVKADARRLLLLLLLELLLAAEWREDSDDSRSRGCSRRGGFVEGEAAADEEQCGRSERWCGQGWTC